MKAFFLILTTLALAACNGERNDLDPPRSSAIRGDSTQPGSTKPFAELSPEERDALKEELMQQGLYDCCARPGCTLCIANNRRCSCYVDIKKKDPICGDCLEAYKEGHGKLKLMNISELEKIQRTKGRKIQ